MSGLRIEIDRADYRRVCSHLMPVSSRNEQAVFLFANHEQYPSAQRLRVIDVMYLFSRDFAVQSEFFLELEDGARSRIFMKAQKLNASIIECHSHPSQKLPHFSISDIRGFDEFAPHVLWRLPNRPFVALVFGKDQFDGLVWEMAPEPSPLGGILIDTEMIYPTNETLRKWDSLYEQ